MALYDLLGNPLQIGALRRDSDAAIADGTIHQLHTNGTGRLKVSTTPAGYTDVVSTVSTSTGTVSSNVTRVSNVTVHVKGGTVNGVGGNFTFEASLDSTNGTDGTWFGIQAARTNSNTIESATGALSLNIGIGNAYAWEASVNAYNWFRVRYTALTSGNYVVSISHGAFATEPAPAIGTHAVTMTSTTLTAVTPGVAAANLGKAEDAAHASGDTGVMGLGVRNDNTATARSSANGDYDALSVDANGALFTRDRPAPTSAVTSVASSATNVTVLASNAARRGASVYNDSTAILYLKLGATASTTSFTIKMAADSYYEIPADYSGVIDGIWASANGSARVTEIS